MNKWQSRVLLEICNITAGGDVPKENFSKEKTENFQIPIFSNGIGKDALYGYTNIPKINPPCITVAARGSIGYCALRTEPFYPIIRLICIKAKDEKLINIKYIYYFLQNTRIKGSESGIPQLTIPMISKYKINLPDLETQGKIVAILEKWDAAIENLKQQILEEEIYFKWLNQKLFRQKRYASGVNNIAKMSDVASVKTGKKDVNQGNPNGKYPFFTCAKEPSRSDDYSFEGEAILLAGNGEIGTSFYYDGKFEAYQRTYVLQDFRNCKSKFVFYVINYLFKQMVEKEKQMSAMPYIKLRTLQDFAFYLPPIKEQEKIIEILDTQDQKLSLLRQKLANYESQRKYLLNRLLLGKEDI